MDRSLTEVAKEIRTALYPMPDGYIVKVSQPPAGIWVANVIDDLAFYITPGQIEDGTYLAVAKQSMFDMFSVSPPRGHA